MNGSDINNICQTIVLIALILAIASCSMYTRSKELEMEKIRMERNHQKGNNP